MKAVSLQTFKSFLEFAQAEFQVEGWFNGKDGGLKKESQKTKSLLFHLLSTVWLATSSIVATEELFGSLSPILDSLNLRLRAMSDSLIEATLRTIRMGLIRKFHLQVLESIKKKERLYSPLLKEKIVGIIDGTHTFNCLYACCCIISGYSNILVDFEAYKKGKELVAASKVLERILSKQFIIIFDVIVADALYLTTNIVKKLHKAGVDFVIKVSESKESEDKVKRAYRVILRLAREAVNNFRRNSQGKLRMQTKGMVITKHSVRDKVRNRRYTVYRIFGLQFAGISVYVQYVVPGFRYWGKTQKHRTENFFVVTSIDNPTQAVLLATERWQVEETFDVMKNEFKIKNDFIYKGNLKAFRRFFTIVMIAMNIILYYAAELDRRLKGKLNLSKFIRQLREGIVFYTAFMLQQICDHCSLEAMKELCRDISSVLTKSFA